MIKIQAIGTVGKKIETTPAGQTNFSVLVYEDVNLGGRIETKATAILCSASAERVKNIKTGSGIFIRGAGGAELVKKEDRQYPVFTCKPSWIQFGKEDKSMHNLFIEGIGYIGGETRQAAHNDKLVCNFSIASNDKELNNLGQKVDVTTWLNCSLWRDPERGKIFDYLTKGTRVYVAGKPMLRVYGDNNDRLNFECRVSELELLGGKKADDSGSAAESVNDSVSAVRADIAGGNPIDDLPW
jgi:single-strand DNA-binding protein